MHKITHPKFELDLTNYGLSITQENYWFTDRFFTKYSFPFNIYLNEKLIRVFGYFLDDNNNLVDTTFNVTYFLGNKIESAIFEIESQLGKNLKASVRFGFDELPNWDKKLNELPLEIATVTNIYTHAAAIVLQKWPAVNYNYPQIFTDKYDLKDEKWKYFQGINIYGNGYFAINEYTNEESINRNIIQPLAYLLHILKVGFLDAGYVLKGDVLTNETIKQILIFNDIDYFDEDDGAQFLKVFKLESDSDDEASFGYFNRIIELESLTEYRITGTVYANAELPQRDATDFEPASRLGFTNIKYRGTILGGVSAQPTIPEVTKNLDITFTTDANDTNQKLDFYSEIYLIQAYPEETVFDLTISKVIESGANAVVLKNELDLSKVVPKTSFGDFVTSVKNLYNFGLDIIGTDIYMNFIEEEMNYNDAVSLQDYEVMEPPKRFNRLDSVLLKYQDASESKTVHSPVFISKGLIRYNEDLVNDKTDRIEIAMWPLPRRRNESGITTSYFDDFGGDDKLYIVLYDSLDQGRNTTLEIFPILIPEIYENNHKKWINFRLNSTTYNLSMKLLTEKLVEITNKVFIYGRYHIVKSIDKTQIAEDLFEVQIETNTLD